MGLLFSIASALFIGAAAADLDVLHHLGANSPWFIGPNKNRIADDIPERCAVDQAIYIVRHGSRYPDPGAYQQWTDLHEKVQNARFTARGSLAFLKSWTPVLENPKEQLSMVSPGGYRELYSLGSELRFRYPEFYKYESPYLLWANDYQRVVDSARLFARGYIGPNSTLASVHVINSRDGSAVGNSLATSDSCPTFKDSSGADVSGAWDKIFLPPIARRLNRLVKGDLVFNETDVSLMPYLCGFETQITGRRSQWCHVLTENEILDYEYRQDLRYYYGTGPGAGKNSSVQFPLLQGIVDLLNKGPGASAKGAADNLRLPALTMAFTNDNQINELASIVGIFDGRPPLSPFSRDDGRLYISSNITPMRGTVAFERLNCSGRLSVRLRLNDAIYPVPGCDSAPGRSCPLAQYTSLVRDKFERAGSFDRICNVAGGTVAKSPSKGVTFFTDLALPAIRTVMP